MDHGARARDPEAATAAPPLSDAPTVPWPLAAARLAALRVDLETKTLLSWVLFRRRERARRELSLPPAERLDPSVSRLRLALPADEAGHLELRLPMQPGEHFVGFGERFNAVDQRGWKLETWSEEGAVGLGERSSPWLTRLGVGWNPFPKGPTTAYKPLPFFLSSSGYGVLLCTSAPVFFDVGASDADTLVCEIAATEVEILIFEGSSPAHILEHMTAREGRSRGLPDWALAPWNDAIGGQDEVRRVARVLRQERIPSSVIWYEDWQGGQWRLDWWLRTPLARLPKWLARLLGRRAWYSIFPVLRTASATLYPETEALNGELHHEGFKALSYYYPYLATSDPDYADVDARGWLLKRHDGSTATFEMLGYTLGQLDLTHPGGRAWYRGELERGLALGFDGWMADFGEYVPVDALTASGEPGLEHHNRYPVAWAALHRQTLDDARPDGDYVFFSRSAGRGQQALSPVFWGGDSNTDFERWDGLPSNLRALLSAGLSGMSIWATDIGGYMSMVTRGRDRETLARWVELAAFLAVMRTHHGTHPKRSVQFDADAGTMAHYRRFARLHTALFPLLRALVDEAGINGLPVCRALLLHHPDDATAWQIEDQFLLGRDLLVAPVLERGATARQVYLPAGEDWIDLWTGDRHAGARTVQCAAPIGVIPLFLRERGLVATFDSEVDTLVRRAQAPSPGLRTLDDAEGSLSILVGPRFTGPARLWDGSIVERVAPGSRPTLLPSPPFAHALLPEGLLRHVSKVGSGFGSSGLVCIGDSAFAVAAPRARRWTLYLTGQ